MLRQLLVSWVRLICKKTLALETGYLYLYHTDTRSEDRISTCIAWIFSNPGRSTRDIRSMARYMTRATLRLRNFINRLLVPARWSGTGLLITGSTRIFSNFFVLTTVATSEVAIILMFVATSNQSDLLYSNLLVKTAASPWGQLLGVWRVARRQLDNKLYKDYLALVNLKSVLVWVNNCLSSLISFVLWSTIN